MRAGTHCGLATHHCGLGVTPQCLSARIARTGALDAPPSITRNEFHGHSTGIYRLLTTLEANAHEVEMPRAPDVTNRVRPIPHDTLPSHTRSYPIALASNWPGMHSTRRLELQRPKWGPLQPAGPKGGVHAYPSTSQNAIWFSRHAIPVGKRCPPMAVIGSANAPRHCSGAQFTSPPSHTPQLAALTSHAWPSCASLPPVVRCTVRL